MSTLRRLTTVALAASALSFALAGCSSEASIVGVWTAPDGSTAFVNADGTCSGMYYNNGVALDIGGPMTCAHSGDTLVVSQPPNQATYSVVFDGDTMSFNSGGIDIVFTRAD